MANSRMAVITFFDEMDGGRPDNSLPGFPGFPNFPNNSLPGSGRPDNSLPGLPNYPSNALPGGGHISLLPVFPFDPTKPDNSLPGEQPTPTPPIQIHPGAKFVVKWLACHGLILVPDNSLPETAEPK